MNFSSRDRAGVYILFHLETEWVYIYFFSRDRVGVYILFIYPREFKRTPIKNILGMYTPTRSLEENILGMYTPTRVLDRVCIHPLGY